MSDAQKAAASSAPAEQKVELSLLDQIVEEGRFGREAAATERGKDLVKEFVAQVLQGEMAVSRDAEAMINARIAQIDHLLSIQLNEVLHHPTFQKLEASWRGLKYLLDNSSSSSMLKIRVLNASKKELLRDLQRAPEFDQSALFKKVYEEEFGIFGGEPLAIPKTWNWSRRSRRLRPRRMLLSCPPRRPICSTSTASPTWAPRATWERSSTAPSTPSGSPSARATIPATWRSPCRTS
jgi:predicted component of type VI protein secretion system